MKKTFEHGTTIVLVLSLAALFTVCFGQCAAAEIVPAACTHRYVDGVCTLCGEKPSFVTGTLDARFYEPVSENAGHIETVRFKTPANDTQKAMSRAMTVYVPYNYDPAQKYDVFFLLHGQNGRRDFWFEELHEEDGLVMDGKNLCDHLFAEGYLKPMLLVAIDTCIGNTVERTELGDARIRYELRSAILPTIVENYSTYAESSSYEDMVAAREHFGIGGVSNGSLYTLYSGLISNLELFSNYMCLSGFNNAPAVRERLDADAKERYPVYMFFCGAGDDDYSRQKTDEGYEILIEGDSPLEDGQNAVHVIVEGEHGWRVWFTELYNALPLMFP